MNELVFQAKVQLIECGVSPYEASLRLNGIPMGQLKYAYPREAFANLAAPGSRA